MKINKFGTAITFLFSASLIVSGEEPPRGLTVIQEAYKAAMGNLHSGSGTGTYEIYAAPPGKGTKAELKVKAKAKVFFDHDKFHIHLDYEKDDIHHLESRVIIYDGTAVIVNRRGKYIQPSHSEGEVYEASPTLPIMRKVCFDYNPCELPSNILSVDLLSKPSYASAFTIEPVTNMDYTGTFVYAPSPNLRCSFVASHKAGFNIVVYQDFLANRNNFLYTDRRATWDRKKDVWYIKSIDTHWNQLDGSSERTIFQYTDFEPNAEVSPSLFKFNALSLSPTARVIDRRPNVEEPVLRQSQRSRVAESELNTLADKVKSLTPPPPPPQVQRLRPLWRKYLLLVVAVLLCIAGLLLLWKRRRQRDIRSDM